MGAGHERRCCIDCRCAGPFPTLPPRLLTTLLPLLRPPQVVKSFIASGRGKAAAIASGFKAEADAAKAKEKREGQIHRR